MDKKYGRITGWGAYTPQKIVTNFDLEKIVDTSNEWIVKRTGIHERRIVADHETTATMSVIAAEAALAEANISPHDIDLIIVATTTPDHLAPSIASQVQHMIGATNTPAFTLMTGCTGFVYGLNTAQQFVANGTYQTILVVGAELLSRFVDWSDRATCVLFGDGAGAVVIEASDIQSGVLGFDMGSDGSLAKSIIVPGIGSANPPTPASLEAGQQYIQMNGREVFKFATRVVGKSCARALSQAHMTLDDIDWIVPHQANLRIIQAAARDMAVPLDKFIISIQKYGNTSAASIPIAVVDAIKEGRIRSGDTLLLASFGSGLTWASAVVQLSGQPLTFDPTEGQPNFEKVAA